MSKRRLLLGLAVCILAGLALYQIPAVKNRLDWRIFRVVTYLNGIIRPVRQVPTALPGPSDPVGPTVAATPSIQTPTATPPPPTFTPEPLPGQVALPAPEFEDEKKFPNNCGPATLTMALRMAGWTGDQFDISDVIKPKPDDRNVNPDELRWWVLNNPGGLGLKAEYRVNGNLIRLKQLLAARFPVMLEKTFTFDSPYWPNDDLWAAHYVLLTGYDDTARTFTMQDAFHGPNLGISYDALEEDWEPFNRVYLVVYRQDQEVQLQALLGSDWDVDANRHAALNDTQAATTTAPGNAFAWFNYGSNLVYFDRYEEANQAYDTARRLGLPQRMMRYQFGPFLADFHTNRFDDLLVITQDTIDKASYKWSEEAWLWKGWALYRTGDPDGAIRAWNTALSIHPQYCDAQDALSVVQQTPKPAFCIP